LGVVLLVVAAACSNTNPAATQPSTTGAAPRSLTPLVTTGPAAARLSAALLTTADLRATPGAPADVRAVPANSAKLFADPDPRAPCGKHLAQPDLSASAGVAFQSSSLAGFEFVVAETVARAGAYVSALASDTHQGCAAYRARTNTGTLQTVALITPVALPHLADQQTAALLRFTNQGQTGYASEAAFRVGPLLAIEVLLAPSPPTPTFVRAVAARAVARLKLVPGDPSISGREQRSRPASLFRSGTVDPTLRRRL